MPEPSSKLSNLYTLDKISARLSVPMDELREILDFYRPRNFPSVIVGSDTLYTEQALDNISTLRSLEETKLPGQQPMKQPARFPEAKTMREVSERATRKRIAAKRRKDMAKRKAKKQVDKPERTTLHTLTSVSKQTGISMPTLQKYKKLYQRRIPHVSKGRKQRYPEEALAVFAAIKEERLKKRGRPKKTAKKRARKLAPKKAAPTLLSLLEISRRTGISYPTLLRYVKLHGKQIPSKGSGRKRRYPEEAVAVFQELRSKSKRGRKPAKRAVKKVARAKREASASNVAIAAQVQELEKGQRRIEKQLAAVIAELKKPIRVTIRGG